MCVYNNMFIIVGPADVDQMFKLCDCDDVITCYRKTLDFSHLASVVLHTG